MDVGKATICVQSNTSLRSSKDLQETRNDLITRRISVGIE
jgi:hypothetical protein